MFQSINLMRTIYYIQDLRQQRPKYLIIHGFYKMVEKLILTKKKVVEFLTYKFVSTFNVEKLNSIYSNLDTISFYNLITNMDSLISKGYNPILLIEKKHFYLSLPFFLILMVCLASMFTLNSNERRQNTYYILLSILLCVVIFYFKIFQVLWELQKKYQ